MVEMGIRRGDIGTYCGPAELLCKRDLGLDRRVKPGHYLVALEDETKFGLDVGVFDPKDRNDHGFRVGLIAPPHFAVITNEELKSFEPNGCPDRETILRQR
jgi:hypothetical protein